MAVDRKNTQSLIRMGGATLSGTTPYNSNLADMRGYEALTVALQTLTVTDAGTASGFTLKLQHSDSTATGTFVDCTTNEVIPTSAGAITIAVTADTDDDLIKDTIGYRGNKRYVRAVVTGTTLTDAGVLILGVLSANSNASAPVPAVVASTAAT